MACLIAATAIHNGAVWRRDNRAMHACMKIVYSYPQCGMLPFLAIGRATLDYNLQALYFARIAYTDDGLKLFNYNTGLVKTFITGLFFVYIAF